MAKKIKSPLELLQTDSLWYCAVRQLRTFIPVDEQAKEFFRPDVVLVADMQSGMMLMLEVIRESLSAKALYSKLVGVMLAPPEGTKIHAQRPAEIHFEDEALVEAIQPLLTEVQIAARYQPQKEAIDNILQDLERNIFGDSENTMPGLLAQRGVTPEQIGSLFAAARAFYQAKPWNQLSNFDILAVQVKPQKQPYYVIVMGQGGEEFGLSVFRNWQEVEEFFTARHPLAAVPRGGRNALLFNRPPFVSFDDLDAIEKYGWELPEPYLVPTPVIYMARKVKRPDATMLRWYEAAMRAIPRFVSDHLKSNPDGTHPPVEVIMEVETDAGAAQVHIRYPGGDLDELENRLSRWAGIGENDDDLDLVFDDQEGMEGDIASLLGNLGAISPDSDPALQKAQQIMYDAWEEPRPAQLVVLAKKALKASPNCADAYVLLAHEQAKTEKHALAYYQAGVEAGRRALGEDFFEDPRNIGHFWGIFETRPFMRALHGLASTQQELGLHEEAERNYREMLRLNPGDNQGIRYLLLYLLLELGQDDQARALLKEYPNEWSTEAGYTTALLAFREKGDSPESRQALKRAVEINKHVPDFLTGKKPIPSVAADFVVVGGTDEAADYATLYLNYWLDTPGAIDWLHAARKKRKK